MGCLFSKTEIILQETIDFPVRVEIVEQTFRDTTSVPNFVPAVTSVQFVRGQPGTRGACWNEGRIFQGREITLHKTITDVSENPFTYSVHVEYFLNTGCCTPSPENTSTFVIQPGHKDGVCTGSVTTAFVSRGIIDSVLLYVCMPWLKSAFTASMLEGLKHFSQEAVRRERCLMEKDDNGMEPVDGEMSR